MKTVIEQEDIELIAQRVTELIKPFLLIEKADDVIFSVDELAAYLSVSPKWVYDHKRKLPHFKPGGLLRFRKKDIDKEIDKLSFHEQTKKTIKRGEKKSLDNHYTNGIIKP